MRVRSIEGKLFSKQITSPNVMLSNLSGWIRSPGVSSYGICCSAEIHESFSRNGTYSPNGTRCTLRYSPMRRASPRPADVHLDRRHVEGSPVGPKEGDEPGGKDQDERHPNQEGGRRGSPPG